MTALLQSIDDIVYGRVVAAVALAVVAFQFVVLVMAFRRQPAGRAPLPARLHLIAGVAIAILPIAAVISVHAARGLMFGVFFGAGVDPGEKATDLSRGMAGQTSGIALSVSIAILAVGLWGAGIASTVSKARAEGRARSFPPAFFVGIGLLPSALGALQWSTGTIKTFVGLAGVPPAEKGIVLEQHLDVARGQLVLAARASTVGILILTMVGAILIAARARSGGAAAAPARARSPRLPLAVSAAAIALAVVLMLAARPIAAENQLPWPPTTGSQYVWPGGPPTPKLVGPDPPERAPVVTVLRDSVKLDGSAVDDLTDLELKLGTLANNFKLLHPGEDFNEMALIEADAATPVARLTSVLRAVRGAWYYHPMFAFTTTESHVRPVLGKLERVVVTGARFRLAFTNDEEGGADSVDSVDRKSAVPLRPEDFADYDAFARRLVELRRAGKPVLVKVPRASDSGQ